MEDLPDDVIISNIETFRNIIKQQKSYVDEMQLHLSNKDNVILGLQQTIKLLESTIECNQELIEKLRKEKESNVQHVYDITNELKILDQLEEKEQIISEMLITYIPREQHALEIKRLNVQYAMDITDSKEKCAMDIESVKEQCAMDIESVKKQCAMDIEYSKEQCAMDIEYSKEQHAMDIESVKKQCAMDIESVKKQHALDITISKEQYAMDITNSKEQCALDITNSKEQHAKNITNSSLIKDKIKKKYIKKELEIYKNENIALKNQIEFFKNMVMMHSMCKMHDFSYNYQPPPSYTPHQPPSSHTPYTPHQPPPSHTPPPSTPHRSTVKTEQITSNNNENQHKNKMGNVLEQLQQLQQKQKQKDTLD